MQIKRTKLSLWHSNMAIGNHPLIDDLRINVGCWLVGRLAIVPKKHKLFNYSEPMHCLAASLLWQEILGGAFFCQKKVCGKNLNTFFSEKNLASLHVPKESDRLLNPYWRTVFPQISKALGHERVQFTLVVCSHGSQLQLTFPELILEPREERPFTQAIAKFKVQTFPTRIRPLIKPLFKNSFSTNFQGTGPWEGPIHFSGLFARFTIAANFSRADPRAKRRKKRLLQTQLPSSKAKPFPKESDRLLNPY